MGYPPNPFGGLDVYTAETFEYLRDSSVDIELVLLDDFTPEDPGPGIHTVNTEGGILDRYEQLSTQFTKMAADYDVVHTHDFFSCEPGIQAVDETTATWVATFHSTAFDRRREPAEIEIENEQKIVDNADHLLAVSELLAETVENKYGKRPDVLYNGFSEIDMEASRPAITDSEPPVVLFVGRHSTQKGLPELLEGFSRISREAELVIGGTGPITPRLKEQTTELGISDEVTFEGYIPDTDLGSYYWQADAFVSPSVSEPFGLTITEALSAGTPVVATESGVEELLPDDTVVSVDCRPESIAAGIEEGLERTAVPEYQSRGWDECAAELREYYRSI